MASIHVPAQGDKTTEEVRENHKEETKHLLFSGVRNLAISDDSLTQQEQTQILDATHNEQNNTDGATEAGEDLRGMANDLDGLLVLDDFKFVRDFIDGVFDEDNETLMDRIKQFFLELIQQVRKKGISKATVMILIMVGYALIRCYLKRFISENILTFIEKLAPILYQAFQESGVLEWIIRNGGWGKLKSFRIKKEWVFPIALAVGIIGVGIYHITHV